MSEKLEELKKELVQEIKALANDLAKSESYIGLLSYEGKFNLLHEKFVNLKFLERKHMGLDIFDSPIPMEDEKQEIFSVSTERFEDEPIQEYHFKDKEVHESTVSADSIPEVEDVKDIEDSTANGIVGNTSFDEVAVPSTNIEETYSPQQTIDDVDDFKDLLPHSHLPTIQLDFNDRIAFLNQLFDGNQDLLKSTIHTLNHMTTFADSKSYIKDLGKDMNWKDKEEYIERLTELIAKRFD